MGQQYFIYNIVWDLDEEHIKTLEREGNLNELDLLPSSTLVTDFVWPAEDEDYDYPKVEEAMEYLYHRYGYEPTSLSMLPLP